MVLPPVLLVHGFGSSFDHGWVRHGWDMLLADQGRPVIGVDLLGHGTSPKPILADAYAGTDDLVASSVDGIAELDAVGFSAGAMVLLRLLSRGTLPVRRAALLGVGDGALEPRASPEELVAGLQPGVPRSIDPQIAAFQRLAADPRNDPRALAAFLQGQPPLQVDGLGGITAEMLLVVGDRDPAGPVDRMAGTLPHAVGLTVPGMDHFSTPSNVVVIERVLKFLGPP